MDPNSGHLRVDLLFTEFWKSFTLTAEVGALVACVPELAGSVAAAVAAALVDPDARAPRLEPEHRQRSP